MTAGMISKRITFVHKIDDTALNATVKFSQLIES
jgi:hypothetical protein